MGIGFFCLHGREEILGENDRTANGKRSEKRKGSDYHL